MSIQARDLDIPKLAGDTMTSVFQTMLALPLEPVPGDPAVGFPEHVSGSVGLGGEKVIGAVYIHMSAEFAKLVASTMLGMGADEIADSDVNDVVGEMCNMVAGGLKSTLCDTGAACAVSTPAIIRGTSLAIETVPDVRQEKLVFECQGSRVIVEVHIKFN
jgi:chemotaxis protein CheX